MDQYETLWRSRAADHGITDVDWYVHDYDGATQYERYTDLATAERRTLELCGDWRPACGRGAQCSDIAPFLGGTDRNGYFSSVEALLDDEYDDA